MLVGVQCETASASKVTVKRYEVAITRSTKKIFERADVLFEPSGLIWEGVIVTIGSLPSIVASKIVTIGSAIAITGYAMTMIGLKAVIPG